MKKIIKKLISKIFDTPFQQKVIDYNFPLFLFFWGLTFSLAILEGFTYSGFLAKHFFLDFRFILLLMIISGTLASRALPRKTIIRRFGNYHQILLKLNVFLFPLSLIVAIIIVFMEGTHFPNYVFSSIHFHPRSVYWPPVLSLFYILLNLGWAKRTTRGIYLLKMDQNKPRVFFGSVLIGLGIFVIMINAYNFSADVIKNMGKMVKYPLASYDEKMNLAWKDFYNYMLFVKVNTTTNAFIAHPPLDYPWLDVGNQLLVDYFLYPRRLVQNNDELIIDERAEYVMIAWGAQDCGERKTPCHGWPKAKVPAEWILYKKKDSAEIEKKIEDTIYNPEDEINQEAWGLIKIKRD